MAHDWYGTGRPTRDPYDDPDDRHHRSRRRGRYGGRREGSPGDDDRVFSGDPRWRGPDEGGPHEDGRGEFWPGDREVVREARQQRRREPEAGFEDRPDRESYGVDRVWPRSFAPGYRADEPSPGMRRHPAGDAGRGRFRGVGPRGYIRSDERILDDVNDRLTEDPDLDASDIEVSIAEGEVTLEGTVDSREAKRRAEDDVEDVSGVAHCQNNLRVRGRTRTPSGTAEPSAQGARGEPTE